MDRLTTPDGDYCRDECGMANSCKRLRDARLLNDLSRRCDDALRYDRLRMYENIEAEADAMPETVPEGTEAFLREAAACEAERVRLENRINQIRARMKTDHSQELRDKLAMYQQMAFEMKVKSRCFRRKADERRQQS